MKFRTPFPLTLFALTALTIAGNTAAQRSGQSMSVQTGVVIAVGMQVNFLCDD